MHPLPKAKSLFVPGPCPYHLHLPGPLFLYHRTAACVFVIHTSQSLLLPSSWLIYSFIILYILGGVGSFAKVLRGRDIHKDVF